MNIAQLLTKAAVNYPERLALAKGKREQKYFETERRVNALTSALFDLGVRKGHQVGILQSNGIEFLESLFACFKGGMCAVPVNPRLHRKEWSYIFDHSEARAVIFTPEYLPDVLMAKDDLPGVRHWICVGNPPGESILHYNDLIRCGSPAPCEVEVERDDLAWLFYSSGTTGKPKGVMLTHDILLRMTMNLLADIAPVNAEDAILHAAPLSHGSGCCALPNLARGAANIILDSPSFEPEAVFRTIQERRITNMFAAPTMVKILLDSPHYRDYDLSSLQYVVYAGAPMYVEDLKTALRKFGPIFVQLFGQAEAIMTITYLPREQHKLEASSEEMKRLASAGIARTDVEVKIVGAAGNDVPCGTVGEIVTRSDLVMKGYWKDPGATAKAIRNGWLYTGDVGMQDAHGYVYILDRSKDMIISGGSNIYPREVEEVLLTHPAVNEACVIGVPDQKWGEAVKALVVLKSGHAASETELIEHCKQQMATYKKPKSVELRSELPKNSFGKVLKRELRAPFWAGCERSV